jgi:hypothetical protein
VLICCVATQGRLPAESHPQVVVAAGVDRPPVGTAQQLPGGGGAALLGADSIEFVVGDRSDLTSSRSAPGYGSAGRSAVALDHV